MSAVIWFVTTLVFGWYVTRFADYSIVYGSLGAAVATLVWLYITALAVFLGAEYNAQVEADRIAQAESFPQSQYGTHASIGRLIGTTPLRVESSC